MYQSGEEVYFLSEISMKLSAQTVVGVIPYRQKILFNSLW